jgi:hypothetical protein
MMRRFESAIFLLPSGWQPFRNRNELAASMNKDLPELPDRGLSAARAREKCASGPSELAALRKLKA